MDILQIRKKVGAKEVLYRSGLKQTAGSIFWESWFCKRHLECGAFKLSVYKMVDSVHAEKIHWTSAQNKIFNYPICYGDTNIQGNQEFISNISND